MLAGGCAVKLAMNEAKVMKATRREVSTVSELLAAVADASVEETVVVADLTDAPTFRLLPGQTLVGAKGVTLRFGPGQDGAQLSTDNRIEALVLKTDPDRRALFNDTTVERLGRLQLRDLRVDGVVELLVRDTVRGGHVEAHDLDIVAADATRGADRPKGYGVEVIPGAFTLWNQQPDPAVAITAELIGLKAGRPGAPVKGSGIFVSGGGDQGGRLTVSKLETGPVYSEGCIPPGVADRISGGVFVVSGAFVDSVRNLGAVTTYGPNDMVLDNWGAVDRWVAEEKIASFGPSGIGFVNFGSINLLQVKAPIETVGQGARGFNVYAGAVNSAEFERIVTHGDGAVGIQISQPVGEIKVRRGIETFGGAGDSLVKGVVTRLSAIGLSVKPGGFARRIEIAGGLIAHGSGVIPLELHAKVETLKVSGGLSAGPGFESI
jgi:hypothetical protein